MAAVTMSNTDVAMNSGTAGAKEKAQPAKMGAMIPATRLMAEAVPHAVARIVGAMISGVYP